MVSGETSGEAGEAGLSLELDRHLLRTKLFVPPVRPSQIERPRLVDLVNGGLERSLILVSAPAGYGKTTLVSSWLSRAGIPSAWLSLDERDNDPVRFLQYLQAALLPLVPAVRDELVALSQGLSPGQYESLVNLLTNELASHPGPFVLVLDDYHVIRSEAVQRICAYLLEHLPPPMHLALLTRTDPPLPLPRLRARGQLLDIRAEALRFTPDETADFLTEAMGLRLSPADLSALEKRTEGWIAGLQLAALSMQASPDVHAFVSAFTGSHHYVMDYLAEEVLRLQPPPVSAFLLQTSILDRLCGPLCEALLEDSSGAMDGQAMLEALESMNLFIVPLDDERRWYRYHHLFADVLRKRLQPDLLPGLHKRASLWYEQNGFISESIQQAIAAGDHARAASLIEQNGCFLLISGEVATLLGWTDAIEFQSDERPWLAIQKAWALALNGDTERVEPILQPPERLLSPLEPSAEVLTMRGTIAAARAFCANARGDARAAAGYARLALEQLPDCSSISRSIRSVATLVLGDTSWINGDLEAAARAYTEANSIGREAGNLHMVVIANADLADVCVERGLLHQAADIYTRSLEMAVRPDGQRSPLAGPLCAGLGRLSYEWDRLEESEQYLRQCIDLSRQWGDLELQAYASARLARLETVGGNIGTAGEAVRLTEQLIAAHPLPPRRSALVRYDLGRVWLAQGDLDRLERLVRESGIAPRDEIPCQREPEYALLARLFLARRQPQAALALAGRLVSQAEPARRVGSALEALVLQALAYQALKDTGQTLVALEEALALARQEGYLRSFLDEGEAMTRLLCQLRSRRAEGGYAEVLLDRIGGTAGLQPSMQLLSEPLTAREVEVLGLIASGCTNADIAARLVVSLPTVKRHISNIYTKLDVDSRTQAVAIGKQLKILA